MLCDNPNHPLSEGPLLHLALSLERHQPGLKYSLPTRAYRAAR
jgi:hypothetical protein